MSHKPVIEPAAETGSPGPKMPARPRPVAVPAGALDSPSLFVSEKKKKKKKKKCCEKYRKGKQCKNCPLRFGI